MEQKIIFFINPNAGVKKKINIQEFIFKNFSKKIDYEIILWKIKSDIELLKQKIETGNYSTVVACGGDGTVNMVASLLMNTPTALGILPLGSGNGLARSNKIPLDLKQALMCIEKQNIVRIDAALLNGIPFFCTAGVGFDALIANEFASSTKRGLATYVKTTIKNYLSYKPNAYRLNIDNRLFELNAFLITIANAGQWGNDVYIAPKAELSDGVLNISILKPFLSWSIPAIGFKLFLAKIHLSNYLISEKGKLIQIEFNGELPVHYDGEPILVKEKINIQVLPLALRIVH